MAQGALHFGANATDRVSLGQPAAMLNMTVFTILAVLTRTGTLASNKAIFAGVAQATGGTPVIQFRLNSTGGNIELRVTQVTTVLSLITNTTPFSGTGIMFAAATYDQAAGTRAHTYFGTTPANVAEATYGTNVGNSAAGGNKTTEAGTDPFVWGNRAVTSAFADPWPGDIAVGAVFNAALSLADIQSWCAIPRKTVGTNVAVEFARAGKNGADWIDYAGNTGTVTGATQIDGGALSAGGVWTRAA